MKKILKIIYVIIILIVVLINLFSIFHLSFFGFRLYRVGSGSMEPYLKVDDYILVKKQNEYKKDDVITYKIDKSYITHRIIEINEDKIITKGDANNTEDEPINKDNIIGKVILKVGVLGFIIYLFSRPLSWILLFIIGLLITILMPHKKMNN